MKISLPLASAWLALLFVGLTGASAQPGSSFPVAFSPVVPQSSSNTVTTVAGTANQVSVNGSTTAVSGAVTISLPSAVTINNLTAAGATPSVTINDTSSTNPILFFQVNGGNRGLIQTSAGTMFITATTTSPTMILQTNNTSALTLSSAQALRLNGSGYASIGALSTDGSGNVTTASDSRLKFFDHPFVRGLDAIRGLKPVVFHWSVASGYNVTDINAGFFAQDVLPYIPEAVGKNKQGFYSLLDRPITAALVNAVNELADRPGSFEIRVFEVMAFVGLILGLRANLLKP